MHGKRLRRLAIILASLVVLVLALAPAAFAGGCDEDEEDCDEGAAGGGVGTGLVMDSDGRGDVLLAFALASGGIILITAGGLAVRRQNR